MSENEISSTELNEEGGNSLSSSISVKQTTIDPFTIDELTQGTLNGLGVFDQLAKTMRLHLDREWEKKRINGPEYSTVYIELMQACLAQSVEYVTRRVKLAYEIQSLETENEIKLAQLELAREQLKKVPEEIKLLVAQTSQVEAETGLTTVRTQAATADLDKKPVELSILEAQASQIAAETALTGVRTEAATAELAKIPVEVELLRKQSLRADAEVTLVNKQVEQLTAELTKIPLEMAILRKQEDKLIADIANTAATTTRITNETEQLLPIQVANLAKEGDQLQAQTELTEANKSRIELEATVIPVEIDYKRAQIANMAKQASLLDREIDLKTGELSLQAKQLELSEAQLQLQREELEVKRAQVAAQEAQSRLYDQKIITEKAQVDPSVVLPGSVIDLNNKVLEGQASAYEFDAKNRTAKLVLDTFVSTYSLGDRTVNVTNKLTDAEVGKVMDTLYTSIGVN